MELNLGSANWREEMWTEIFDRAKKKDRIIGARLGEHEFKYALINPQDGYGIDRISSSGEHYEYTGSNVTFWIKDAEKEGRVGLSESGLAFVLERELPIRDFADYVGLHEYVEATQGKDQHGEACRIELVEVFKQNPEFVEAYANWLVGLTKSTQTPERGYFGRAILEFLEVITEDNLNPVKILREFKNQLDSGFHLK